MDDLSGVGGFAVANSAGVLSSFVRGLQSEALRAEASIEALTGRSIRELTTLAERSGWLVDSVRLSATHSARFGAASADHGFGGIARAEPTRELTAFGSGVESRVLTQARGLGAAKAMLGLDEVAGDLTSALDVDAFSSRRWGACCGIDYNGILRGSVVSSLAGTATRPASVDRVLGYPIKDSIKPLLEASRSVSAGAAAAYPSLSETVRALTGATDEGILRRSRYPSLLDDPGRSPRSAGTATEQVAELLRATHEVGSSFAGAQRIALENWRSPPQVVIIEVQLPNAHYRPSRRRRTKSGGHVRSSLRCDPDESRAAQAFLQVRRFEREFRPLVVEALFKTYGAEWARKLPEGMCERWRRARERECGALSVGGELIEYADLGDLLNLAVRRDIWLAFFEPLLGSKPDVEASLSRLNGYRATVAHSRDVSPQLVRAIATEIWRLRTRLAQSRPPR